MRTGWCEIRLLPLYAFHFLPKLPVHVFFFLFLNFSPFTFLFNKALGEQQKKTCRLEMFNYETKCLITISAETKIPDEEKQITNE